MSTSTADRTAGEIDWPDFAARTPAADREQTSKYSLTEHQAIKRLEHELLDRVGADDWRLSTAAPHRKSDGLPYADANPDDPAVVVRWTKDGEQHCVACDRYTQVRDNIRTIGLYIKEKRKMSNRPVKTGQDEFATARLPPGDDDQEPIAIAPDGTALEEEPHEILGVQPDAPEEIVKSAFRAQVQHFNGHPDTGGSQERFQQLKAAREAMLDE